MATLPPIFFETGIPAGNVSGTDPFWTKPDVYRFIRVDFRDFATAVVPGVTGTVKPPGAVAADIKTQLLRQFTNWPAGKRRRWALILVGSNANNLGDGLATYTHPKDWIPRFDSGGTIATGLFPIAPRVNVHEASIDLSAAPALATEIVNTFSNNGSCLVLTQGYGNESNNYCWRVLGNTGNTIHLSRLNAVLGMSALDVTTIAETATATVSCRPIQSLIPEHGLANPEIAVYAADLASAVKDLLTDDPEIQALNLEPCFGIGNNEEAATDYLTCKGVLARELLRPEAETVTLDGSRTLRQQVDEVLGSIGEAGGTLPPSTSDSDYEPTTDLKENQLARRIQWNTNAYLQLRLYGPLADSLGCPTYQWNHARASGSAENPLRYNAGSPPEGVLGLGVDSYPGSATRSRNCLSCYQGPAATWGLIPFGDRPDLHLIDPRFATTQSWIVQAAADGWPVSATVNPATGVITTTGGASVLEVSCEVSGLSMVRAAEQNARAYPGDTFEPSLTFFYAMRAYSRGEITASVYDRSMRAYARSMARACVRASMSSFWVWADSIENPAWSGNTGGDNPAGLDAKAEYGRFVDLLATEFQSQSGVKMFLLDRPEFVGKQPRHYHATRLVRAAYTGPLVKLWNGVSLQDFLPDASGNLSTPAILAFQALGSTLELDTFYDQTGNGRHLVATATASRPLFQPRTVNGNTRWYAVATSAAARRMFYDAGSGDIWFDSTLTGGADIWAVATWPDSSLGLDDRVLWGLTFGRYSWFQNSSYLASAASGGWGPFTYGTRSTSKPANALTGPSCIGVAFLNGAPGSRQTFVNGASGSAASSLATPSTVGIKGHAITLFTAIGDRDLSGEARFYGTNAAAEVSEYGGWGVSLTTADRQALVDDQTAYWINPPEPPPAATGFDDNRVGRLARVCRLSR